ncbi:MAG: glycosyl hydrolase [Fermentimonas sp.]|jgi:hypothetical protein
MRIKEKLLLICITTLTCFTVYEKSNGQTQGEVQRQSQEQGQVQSQPQNHPQKNKGYPVRDVHLDLLQGFINPPEGYGNVPFYWWNGDTLKKERLLEQLDILATSATDGFAVSYIHTHPRIDTLENKGGYGLYGMTEPGAPKIFSNEWWEIWNWFSGECGRRGMGVGLDDYTVGWPGNGFYPDELNTLPAFQGYQGKLVITVDTVPGGKHYNADLPENLLAVVAWPSQILLAGEGDKGSIRWRAPKGEESHVYTITTQPGYVLHPEHGQRLVEVYFNRFEQRMDEKGRKGMNYFFQDELAYPITMRSWSDDFREKFRKRKGYDIVPYLPALEEEIGPETPKVRLDYCEVLMDLSEERYYKPIYEWHAERGLMYGADNLSRGKDPTAYIDYFRANSWYTAPGNDAPARGSSFIETKVSSSITHLYQRPRTWLEAFHSMGWGSSGAWLTQQIDHHFVAGGNLVCMHGLYYSTHGGWWEWAPPDFHFRMPYWPHMKRWLEYTKRMSYLLSQGNHVCDIALLYPTEPMQAYPETKPDNVFATARKLSDAGLDYDFVDFRSLRNAVVSGNTLEMADERYQIIVLADMKAIHFASLQKIVDFYRSGGIVLATGELPCASNRQGENDPEVNRLVKELFGITAKEQGEGKSASKQTNRAGGVGWYIAESPEEKIPGLITPDFLPENGTGKVLHRRIGQQDVYMVTDVQKDTDCFFRAKGRVELWDAHAGTTKPYPVQRVTDEGTWIRMQKETGNSYLIVFSPGEPEKAKEMTVEVHPTTRISLDGEWEVELIPTLNNKWGDYRFPAFDGMIGAEARSFKYMPASPLSVSITPLKSESELNPQSTSNLNPNSPSNLDWTKPGFDDSEWDEEIYGYGPQIKTKADGMSDWETVSFSWQYGVWDNPGGQGYHGLKGKIDDRFFILDKGENQQFRTHVYAPENGSYRIETDGVKPDRVRIDGEEVESRVTITKGWHRLEVDYTGSEKVEFQTNTGSMPDNRKRSIVVIYPMKTPTPVKLSPYANEVASRWNQSGHLMFNPYGEGEDHGWNFRFKTAPGLEEITFSLHGEVVGIWFNGKRIHPEVLRLAPEENNRREYRVLLDQKEERVGQVALTIHPEIGYQGASVFPEPVRFKTSSGILETGDWSEQGALRYYSGGMRYKKKLTLPITGETVGTAERDESVERDERGNTGQMEEVEETGETGKSDHDNRTKEKDGKPCWNMVVLDLGEVVATCEVKVNGESAGILISPPYRLDITPFLSNGKEVEIEVLVYSTLSNHYQTIPTPYRGDPKAGLIGPVAILTYEMEQP